MSTLLTGRAAAPGAAVAPAFLLQTESLRPPTPPERRSGTVAEEVARLDQALDTAQQQLRELAARVASAVGDEEAEIFEAHAQFAADPELRNLAVASIETGSSAESAVTGAFAGFRALLAASSSEYLAARADDLDDVRGRVVAILQGRDVNLPVPRQRSVLVAHELTPSQTASLPSELIAAVVTETGSPTSHAAILARSLGIPAVVACADALVHVRNSLPVAVDGDRGEVVVDPDEEICARYTERIGAARRRQAALAGLRTRPGRTADGHRVELAANIGSPDDLAVAVDAGAEGAGLVRTEFLFQDRRTAPTVDEQVAFYTEVLCAFPGHRVVFRTMDIGADKPVPFITRRAEDNPALGLRGIRLHLQRPQLLVDQLTALLQAREKVAGEDAGRLAIMFPLVSTPAEVREARRILTEVAASQHLPLEGVEVGVMVEVPSAALAAARLAREVDFLSIGTNDLLQYLFAADRLNSAVAQLADVCAPDVLALIGSVVAAGHQGDAWVGVCGEAAADPVVAAALVGLGVDELSMTRVAIPEVKALLGRLEHATCVAVVEDAVAHGTDPADVRARLEAGFASG